MLYFAYGSNMDWSQMRTRCPSARFVCRATLADHRLAFSRGSTCRGCGVADVVVEKDSVVWGVVYEIDEIDVGLLDRSEGFRPGREKNSYWREERHVLREGDRDHPLVSAVYVASREDSPPHPNLEYKQLLIDGANCWHLPPDYIKQLELIEVET